MCQSCLILRWQQWTLIELITSSNLLKYQENKTNELVKDFQWVIVIKSLDRSIHIPYKANEWNWFELTLVIDRMWIKWYIEDINYFRLCDIHKNELNQKYQ